jgi:hypothetical protein
MKTYDKFSIKETMNNKGLNVIFYTGGGFSDNYITYSYKIIDCGNITKENAILQCQIFLEDSLTEFMEIVNHQINIKTMKEFVNWSNERKRYKIKIKMMPLNYKITKNDIYFDS